MPIRHLAMRIKLGKERCCLGVARSTLLNQISRVDAGLRVRFWQYRVCGMAICATGYFIRETETVILAVVAFHVGFDRYIGDLVPGHHLFVAVALHADFGMELTIFVNISTGKFIYCVKIVAIMAGG